MLKDVLILVGASLETDIVAVASRSIAPCPSHVRKGCVEFGESLRMESPRCFHCEHWAADAERRTKRDIEVPIETIPRSICTRNDGLSSNLVEFDNKLAGNDSPEHSTVDDLRVPGKNSEQVAPNSVVDFGRSYEHTALLKSELFCGFIRPGGREKLGARYRAYERGACGRSFQWTRQSLGILLWTKI